MVVPETAQPRVPTVLVVDDDEGVRNLTARVLKLAGYEVVVTANGQEALAVLTPGSRVDVVITDVRMPYMNGYDFAARLVSDFPHLPILFMSGFDIHLGSIALPGPVLAKPFRPEQLTNCLKQLLERPRRSA